MRHEDEREETKKNGSEGLNEMPLVQGETDGTSTATSSSLPDSFTSGGESLYCAVSCK